MSQVKNLRAMFEQRGESSPPDRGRTQGQSPPAAGIDSPRPLSHVRTSFIAIVEKDGRVGLQRDPSTDSALSQNRGDTSNSTTNKDTLSTPIQQEIPPWKTPPRQTDLPKSLVSTPAAKGPSPAGVLLPTPESLPAVTPAVTPAAAPAAPASPAKKPVGLASAPVLVPAEKKTNGSPTRSAAKTAADLTPGRASPVKVKGTPSATSATSSAASNATNAANAPNATHAANAANATNSSAAAAAAAAAKHPSAASKPTTVHPTADHAAPGTPKTANSHGNKDMTKAAATGKHVPKTVSTKGTTKPAKKSPTTASKPSSPTKPTAAAKRSSGSRTPEKKAASVTLTASDKAVTATPKTAASSAGKSSTPASAKKPAAIHTHPINGTGFVKPKPKSPTRPMQLPAGLTSHTAASAIRANLPRQSLSSMSGNFNLAHPNTARSPSRSSISTIATATVTRPTGLKRQNSALNRPRPSIGPPPKQPAHDHPVLRREKEIDEGFLARMMRPTQASANKTIDRAHILQARKQASTVSAAAAAPKRALSHRGVTVTKKSVDTHHKETAAPTTAPVPVAPAKPTIATDTMKPPQINLVDPTPTGEAHPAGAREPQQAAADAESSVGAAEEGPVGEEVEVAHSITSETVHTEGTEADSTAVETVDQELESTETKVSPEVATVAVSDAVSDKQAGMGEVEVTTAV